MQAEGEGILVTVDEARRLQRPRKTHRAPHQAVFDQQHLAGAGGPVLAAAVDPAEGHQRRTPGAVETELVVRARHDLVARDDELGRTGERGLQGVDGTLHQRGAAGQHQHARGGRDQMTKRTHGPALSSS